jgi:hypothetical protein
MYTTRFNFKKIYILPTECSCLFGMRLRTNCNFLLWRINCSLLLGTTCVFELQKLRFFGRGLIVLRILSSVSAKLVTKYTDMRRLTTEIRSENASLDDFVVVRTCTYTNLDSSV